MNKFLSLVLAVAPLAVACTVTEVTTPPAATDGGKPTTDAGTSDPDAETTVDAGPTGTPTPDGCLDGQDMDAEDVDISLCPPIPNAPASAPMNGKKIDLGAWEMGTLSNGETYKYGSLSAATTNPRMLKYDTGEIAVNDGNLTCWAKGYYRLRKMLQTPPAEYVALHAAGFQYRFFQFQSDLRNGATGYKAISSFEDHLVKWVTVIQKDGTCTQPTMAKFKDYAAKELKRRNLPAPGQ